MIFVPPTGNSPNGNETGVASCEALVEGNKRVCSQVPSQAAPTVNKPSWMNWRRPTKAEGFGDGAGVVVIVYFFWWSSSSECISRSVSPVLAFRARETTNFKLLLPCWFRYVPLRSRGTTQPTGLLMEQSCPRPHRCGSCCRMFRGRGIAGNRISPDRHD